MTGDWSRESWELDVTQLDLELVEPLTIANETRDVVTNVFVTLRFASVSGVGEVYADDIESVVKELEAVDPRLLKNPFNLEGVLEVLPPGSARAALDIALHDLAGKIAGLSLTKMLGLKDRPAPPTSVTIARSESDRMVAKARSLADHPILKIKVGFDGGVEVIARIREEFAGKLRIDANGKWTEETAISRLKELEPFDIELCEQPIPAGDHDSLRRVTEATSIPIFADEDVSTSADVAALVGVVDGVNLKLRKAGGIRETVRAIATARAHGLKVMLGSDLVSGIGATAEAHLGPLVDHLDIDGPIHLKDDPFPGVTYDKGRIDVPDLPGLGVQGAPS